MTKIHKRQADKSHEIYLSLYRAVTGTEEEKNIYKQFSPDFDGEPVEVFEGIKHLLKKPYEGPGRTKYVVDDVKVHVIAEWVQYYGSDGKLVTESLKDYTRKTVLKEFTSMDSFLKMISTPVGNLSTGRRMYFEIFIGY